ncbi:MAG: tetratricopeptide repeat protein [Candidatus Promineifilaceae bacterium]
MAGCSLNWTPADTPQLALFHYNESVTETILQTKLYMPRGRPDLVSRPRLIERLDQGLQPGHKLTLVSASAGSGKTTLISEWVAACRRPVAWLSLDEGDGDIARFFTYLIAALQTLDPALGQSVAVMLQSPQPLQPETILTPLLNQISAFDKEFILVLDDYHLVDSQTADEALAFLIDHLPPQMHLAVTTREDPNIPLARYRVRRQMTEIRAADLRFTSAEAAGFLNQIMGLGLTADEITALETRTEGWIAGLQMAALSMQGRADTADFIQGFAGSHRFVLDYLIEEVLRQQPDHVRSFLLQTAILDRLSGPLCDALTGRADSNDMLAFLERGNLFVIPLDDERRWYRYHHLFASVIYTYALAEQPAQIPALHRRASAWFEENGLRAEAIHHALAGQDMARAADLIELAWPKMDRSFQSNTWLRWAQALPPDLQRDRPVLIVAYAWAALNRGDLQTAESRLEDAEQLLDSTAVTGDQGQGSPVGFIVVDEAQFQALPASIASARAYIAQARGDVPGTVRYARRALDLLPENDYVRRGPAAALLGLAYWGLGELDAAYEALAEAMDGFRMAGAISFAISGTYGLADIRIAQGRLREAATIYERSLRVATAEDGVVHRGTAELYLGLGMLQRERGDSQASSQNVQRALELGEKAALDNWPYRVRVARARLAEDQGDLQRALDLLNEAQGFYFPTPVPNLRPTEALKTQIWLKQGRLAEASAWVRDQALSAAGDLNYLHEFDHLTLARVLIARHKVERTEGALDQALELLDRLLQAAEAGGRRGSMIEILIVQALAHQARGDIPAALLRLERALTLAEPEGYVRIFVDEGSPMAGLLQEAAGHTAAAGYIRGLLVAFEGETAEKEAAHSLAEPLSERELDVLRLLATELSGPEIAANLMVSLSTVRTHTRNIYSKLEVNNRRSAVRRAEELGLL